MNKGDIVRAGNYIGVAIDSDTVVNLGPVHETSKSFKISKISASEFSLLGELKISKWSEHMRPKEDIVLRALNSVSRETYNGIKELKYVAYTSGCCIQ